MKKKMIIFLLSYIVTTLVLFLASCGDDNEILGDTSTVTLSNHDSWVEPYHVKGGDVCDVQSFMSARMADLTMSELNTEQSTHLAYSRDNPPAGIMYSFSSVDGGLYSIIDTEPVERLARY